MSDSTPFQSSIKSIDDLRGTAGKLEAILNTGRADAPYTALVTHPHPPSGGTMHHKVVYHAAKVFSGFGLPVLRFNFRGTGLSQGRHDNGYGEVDDVRCALDWLAANFGRPILFAGFSFGANVGLRACCGDARVQGLIALGLPLVQPQSFFASVRGLTAGLSGRELLADSSLEGSSGAEDQTRAPNRTFSYRFLPACGGVPKLFVSGDQDSFCPQGVLESTLAPAQEPKKVVWIAGADHFFASAEAGLSPPGSKLGEMTGTVRAWLTETFLLSGTEAWRACLSNQE